MQPIDLYLNKKDRRSGTKAATSITQSSFIFKERLL